MGMHPTSHVVLEIRFPTQFAKALAYLQLDFATEVEFLLGKHCIITRHHHILERNIVLVVFLIMNPSSKNHTSVLLGILRISQILCIHIVDILDTGILDVDAPDC